MSHRILNTAGDSTWMMRHRRSIAASLCTGAVSHNRLPKPPSCSVLIKDAIHATSCGNRLRDKILHILLGIHSASFYLWFSGIRNDNFTCTPTTTEPPSWLLLLLMCNGMPWKSYALSLISWELVIGNPKELLSFQVVLRTREDFSSNFSDTLDM